LEYSSKEEQALLSMTGIWYWFSMSILFYLNGKVIGVCNVEPHTQTPDFFNCEELIQMAKPAVGRKVVNGTTEVNERLEDFLSIMHTTYTHE
jgi:hypothetical protein